MKQVRNHMEHGTQDLREQTQDGDIIGAFQSRRPNFLCVRACVGVQFTANTGQNENSRIFSSY